MFRQFPVNFAILLACAATGVLLSAGCGTTRSTDTARTATEQLLISDAIDRAVQTVNFQPLAGQSVYFDDSHLADVVDHNYLVSTIRQHLLANGCALQDDRSKADFVVEARAGAVGTDRNDLLFGIPATNVPQILPIQAGPAAIPEVPLAKRRDQRGIAKIFVFAYHRETGKPVWQSGLVLEESSSNDLWVFGAGPFQHGTVYGGRAVGGRTRDAPPATTAAGDGKSSPVDLAQEATFNSPAKLAEQQQRLPSTSEVAQAKQPEVIGKGRARLPPSQRTSEMLGDSGSAGASPSHNLNFPDRISKPAATADQKRELFTSVTKAQMPSSQPVPFSIARDDAPEPLIPNLTEMATEKKAALELMARVYDSQLLRHRSTGTVQLKPPRESDLIALPQPRFDSL